MEDQTTERKVETEEATLTEATQKEEEETEAAPTEIDSAKEAL